MTGTWIARLWCRKTAAADERCIATWLARLAADERARHDRLMQPHDRRDFAAAHALEREALSRMYGAPADRWEFHASASGKPRLSPQPIGAPVVESNLSHTRGWVTCAIAEGAGVGVDIESAARLGDPDEVARGNFSASERDALARCAPDDRRGRFLDFWTLKEAYVKATGLGLSTPLDQIEFRLDAGARIELCAPAAHAAAWHFALFTPDPATRLAVAVHAPAGAPGRIEWGPLLGETEFAETIGVSPDVRVSLPVSE